MNKEYVYTYIEKIELDGDIRKVLTDTDIKSLLNIIHKLTTHGFEVSIKEIEQ